MVDVVQRNRKYNLTSSGGSSGDVTARLLAAGEDVDDRVLDERAEDEDETGRHPDVDRLGERHGGHSTHAGARVPGVHRDRSGAGIPRMWTELCVVMVSIVRMPREMRAGTDSRSIQNDTQDSRTTRRLGRNVDRM